MLSVGYSFTLGVVGVEGGTVRRPHRGEERERGGEGVGERGRDEGERKGVSM